MTKTQRRWALGIAAIALAPLLGCSSDDDTAPMVCVEPSQVIALPHPGWHGGENSLTPPDGDRTLELMRALRPSWAAQLAELDGWPQRPTIVVPLDGAPTAADPTKIALYAADGTNLEGTVVAELDPTAPAVVLQPLDPFPPGTTEVILVLSPGAIAGARPLPTCGADGQPDPAYAQAAAQLPSGVQAELALPFPVADTAGELGALYVELSQTPALEVASVEARALDSFGEFSPDAQTAAQLDAAASGVLTLPAYQNADGRFELDGGAPTAQGTTEPGFVLALPAAGDPPYPFVLYQHGGSQDKANVLPIAGPLAAAGFAIVAIDLPGHGDRQGAAGGSDMDILDFDNPLLTRDNLRQASADHLAVLTGIDALNAALETTFGEAQLLDASEGHYMGLSLGGITGTLTFASAADLRAAALFVGGGGYRELLSHGLFRAFVLDLFSYEGAELAALFGLVELLLDGADPLAYAPFEPRDSAPRPVLFFEAIDDPIAANASTDQWARAFGADLAEPYHHAVDGMTAVSLPSSGGFAWPSSAAEATRLLIQAPMDEVSTAERHPALITQGYSQELVAHCLLTLLDDGACEVIDTGFGEH